MIIATLLAAQIVTPQASFFDVIRKGDAESVRTLLTAHPELAKSRNTDGATPVLWAMYTRHPALAAELAKGRGLDLYEAAALGDEARVRGLIATDVRSIDNYSQDGFTALGLASFFGHRETAREILEMGADPNRASNNAIKVAPLHSAVASGDPELVRLLLAHRAAVDPTEFLGATPLHAAAAEGKGEIVRILLEAGADRSKRTNEGKTAAELALQYKHADVAAEIERYASKAK